VSMSSSNPRTGLPALWSARDCVATLTAASASGNCMPSASTKAGGNFFSAGRAAVATCAVFVSARVVPTSDKRSSFVFDTLNPKGDIYAQEE